MDLIFLCIGWLFGLCLGQAAVTGTQANDVLAVDPWLLGPWLGALAACALGAALLAGSDVRLRITALSLTTALLGIWRAFSVVPEADTLLERTGRVSIQGTVSNRPEAQDNSLLLRLDADRLQPEGVGEWMGTRGRLLVRTSRYQEWGYGDRLVVRGELRAVQPVSGYWADYLARQGIHTTLEYPTIGLLERASPDDPMTLIEAVRTRLDELCVELLPEPHASLLSGILVGSRSRMPVEFRDALNVTSTSHVVAVSGFNVTVVAGIAQLLALRLLARREATLLAIVAVWVYSLLTGLPPSALRAALMATMGLLAILVGRGGDALSFLLFSGAVMVGLDPPLLYDLGFQLSFLATTGLVLLEPVLRTCLSKLPGWLASSLSVTLAAQLATMPVLVSSFHTLSLVSPLTNLLIAPMLPGIMAVGTVVVAAGAVAKPLGELLAPVAWLYLTYLVEVILWTARLPAASVQLGAPAAFYVAAYWLSLLGVALWPLPELRSFCERLLAAVSCVPRWLLAGGAVTLISLMVLAISGRPDGRLHVYFLELGGGESTLIKGPAGHTVLVDGGGSPSALAGALGRYQGIGDSGLDAVVLTGYGRNRLDGLIEVAHRRRVDMVVQPGHPPSSAAGRAWAELLEERQIPTIEASVGQRIPLGDDVWLEVDAVSSVGNGAEQPTLSMRLLSGSTSLLFPGDIPRSVQEGIAVARPQRASLLRVPGQAASGALDERYAQTVAPSVAVLSGKAGERFAHTSEDVADLLRGATTLRTDRVGTVEVVVGKEGYEVYTER
ncbi:MAG TPA: ComEC/Rec2 family competence protein [Chloroflexota bacterium]|nr:ComEC/Rec2 family competence protein [Chloroflexota bacterium]